MNNVLGKQKRRHNKVGIRMSSGAKQPGFLLKSSAVLAILLNLTVCKNFHV